jgi:hypothetical protein
VRERPQSSSTIAAVTRQCRRAARKTNGAAMNAQDRTFTTFQDVSGVLWTRFLRMTGGVQLRIGNHHVHARSQDACLNP